MHCGEKMLWVALLTGFFVFPARHLLPLGKTEWKNDMISQNGYIKLFRGFLDWEWYDDINTSRVFIHCLLKANYSDKNWRGREIKRGSFVTSVSSLSSEIGLSTSKIKTSLNKLKRTNEIANVTTQNYSIISITNYETYQGNDKPVGKRVTNGSQTNGKRMTTTKEGKKERRKEGKEIVLSNMYDFETFWLAFPKRSGGNPKSKAEAKYNSLLKTGVSENQIIDGAERYYEFAKSEGSLNTKYVQQVITWLNQEGWLNDWQPSTKPKGEKSFADIADQMRQDVDDRERGFI